MIPGNFSGRTKEIQQKQRELENTRERSKCSAVVRKDRLISKQTIFRPCLVTPTPATLANPPSH